MKTRQSLTARPLDTLVSSCDNIYKAVAIVAKRAKQIAVKQREALNQRVEMFDNDMEALEEVFENKERIEASKSFEKLPKPVNIAVDELLQGRIMFRNREQSTSAS